MLYQISHATTYHYSEPVALCQNLAHLTPRVVPHQRCLSSRLSVRPRPTVVAARTDAFGNPATFFSVQEMHRELTVTAEHRVEVLPVEPPNPVLTPAWETVRERLAGDRSREVLDAYQFAFASPYARPAADLTAYTRHSFAPGRPILEAALDLTSRIHRDFLYDPRATTVATPLAEVFSQRRGVCQDFAHLAVACLRGLGLAARYVSGYLRTTPPVGQPRLVGADATHAWFAVFVPDFGWIDLDPTNDRIPGQDYVLLAWGRDYDDVSPVKGVILGGGQHSVSVAVDVARVDEPDPDSIGSVA